MTIYATAVAINGRAVLLRGPSGAGKSDVALRLLGLPAEALAAFGIETVTVALVSDDRVAVAVIDGRMVASAPAVLHGLLEVRGVGIVSDVRTAGSTPVALVVDLTDVIARMPDAVEVCIEGVSIPRLAMRPFEASTPLKIALALLQVATTGMDEPGPSAQRPSK